ncbi:arginase family protein [Microbacterium sp. gxy059]|uniref:arginase family protein n=1 Tax=Microbacterium sp. gxy059 TaxID=2957199 RepID=UPI003D9726B0
MARFAVIPQWQGSPSTRAMSLVDGADAIAGDLPRAACTRIDVPYEAGETLDTGVQRASTLRRIRRRVDEALEALPDEPLITIGGDSGVAVPAIGRAGAADDLAVVWFDAHAALHDPATSPSGAFSGMALRAVLGDGAEELVLSPGVPVERVVLAGARALEDAESAFIEESGLAHLNPLPAASGVADAVSATGASRVFIHVDLDVLDPAQIAGVSGAQPFGVDGDELIEAIAAIRERLPLAGASLAGFAPHAPGDAVDDLGTILRIIGALARA